MICVDGFLPLKLLHVVHTGMRTRRTPETFTSSSCVHELQTTSPHAWQLQGLSCLPGAPSRLAPSRLAPSMLEPNLLAPRSAPLFSANGLLQHLQKCAAL